MRKLINYFICATLLVICVSLSVGIAQAHPHHSTTPLEESKVIEFLEKNPGASEEEFKEFLVETYGEQDPINGINSTNVKKIKDDIDSLLSVKNQEESLLGNAKEFTILGIEHILIGLDHILFVLSFVLVLASWRKILSMVTTFTVAHSLTLILAGNNILTLSGKIVEPIIAFSIAYMAITTVFLKKIPFFQKMHSKLGIIFLFGLFHGLGFAGVFSELQISAKYFLSSLLFFNVGVEIGQIMILLFVVPVLILLKKSNKRVYDIVVKVIASIISLLAVFWVIERLF